MNAPLRVVVVGTGWIAQQVHLPHFASNANARLHGLFDTNQERARQLAADYDVRAHSSLDEALSNADVVVICTPPMTHAELAIPALRRGLTVICEKPLATSAGDARAMYDAAVEGGGRLFCCLTNRHRSDVMEMRRQVAAGAIGSPLYLRASWLRGAGIPQTPGAAQSGVLWDLGAHLVDLMMWVTQWPSPIDVQATEIQTDSPSALSAGWYAPSADDAARGPETAIVSCRFPQGAAAHVELSWATHLPADRTSMLLVGAEGTLRLNTVFGFSPDRQTVQGSALELNKAGKTQVLVAQDRQHSEYAHQLDSFVESTLTGDDSWPESLLYAVRSIEVLERARMTSGPAVVEAVYA